MPSRQRVQDLGELRHSGRRTSYPVTLVYDDRVPHIPILSEIELTHGLDSRKGDTPANLNRTLSDRPRQCLANILLCPVFALSEKIMRVRKPQRSTTKHDRHCYPHLRLTASSRGLQDTVLSFKSVGDRFCLIVVKRNLSPVPDRNRRRHDHFDTVLFAHLLND